MTTPAVLNVTLAHASTASTTYAVTIPASTAGSTFIVFYVCGDSDATLSNVTGGSGTWSSKQTEASSVSSWGILSGVSAGTTTLTLTVSTADRVSVAIYEVSNLSGVVDQNATPKFTASGTTITSNSITTTNAEDLIIGCIMGFPISPATPTVTITSSGYTNQTILDNTLDGDTFIKTGYQISSATGTFSYNATTGASSATATYVVSLKSTTVAGGSGAFGDGFFDVM